VGRSPSQPGQVLYRYVEADEALMQQAVAAAVGAAGPWSARPADERRRILAAVAEVMESQRGMAIATMAYDAGKVVAEADTEVSEAVDFSRYYGQQALALHGGEGGAFTPYKVVVVAPPWNFPYAIPAGGTLAALAAGAAVVLKPAPESVLTAWLLVRQCHEAGVPPDVLQFLPCADGEVGQALITHPDVDAVVLTGSFETARRFLQWRPGLNLHAETSGKNALVVSASADVDDAIADLVRSAFSHSGQKCSAASLALVEAELYDDPRFLRRLAGAVKSLRVGPAEDLATQVGPLVRPPDERLTRFLTELAPGESWLVRPEQVGANPQLWRPGVKLGVAPGSALHREEVFGPVLGVMRYRGLDEALALQNAPDFGLTGGAHSLDDRETQAWSEQVEAGNAYVNRHTTGAVVRRQPFGGWKRSCAGHRAKAGGPFYVASMGTWAPGGPARHAEELARAARLWAVLAAGSDPSGLQAEANIWRLRGLPWAVLRVEGAVDDADLAFSLGVAALTGARAELSVAEPAWAGGREAVVESAQSFLARMATARPPRVRYLGPPGPGLLRLMDEAREVVTEPVVVLAERELLCWAREQALSWSLHRHGNVRAHALPLTLTNRLATKG
jgi:RHH-type proline utilization regulon transcriptional repressor/proline dehydrogenase/delta 1-pyrroline-5-carboxylate dehydrogenase